MSRNSHYSDLFFYKKNFLSTFVSSHLPIYKYNGKNLFFYYAMHFIVVVC